MGDSKASPIVSVVGLALILPLLVVIALIVGALVTVWASASDCGTTETEGKTFGWPTDVHHIDQGWQAPDADGYSHSGLDFDVDEGGKVYAAADGEVTSIADNEIRIRHDKGIETRYKYLKEIKVKVHDKVTRGNQIATAGSGDEDPPGLTGDHLHFEMWIDKKDDGHLQNTKPPDDSFGDADGSSDSGAGCCGGGDLTGNNNAQKAFNYLATNGYTKEQAAGIVGNMINESNVEPQRLNGTASGKVTTPSQALGISKAWGVVQWYPGKKMIQPSRQAGKDDAIIGSLAYQLEFLKMELLGDGPVSEKVAGDAVRAAKTVKDAAFQFGFKFERFTTNPNDPGFGQREASAKEVLSTFGPSAPAGASACGAGSGNIAAVAKNLAWPHAVRDGVDMFKKHATTAYRKALYDYNPSAKTGGEDLVWNDCGRFVATVMHMSGADPKYPDVNTGVQGDYLRSSGKYDYWHGEPPGGMKPGDILNGGGHTYFWIGPWGDEGKGYNSASASLTHHVPAAGFAYGIGGQFWVFRLKKAPQPKS